MSANWLNANTLLVRFRSIYTDRYHQLYIGRTLAGCSNSFTARSVQAVAVDSHYPEEISLVAVTADDRLTDFGADLPPSPFNRANLAWQTSGFLAAGVVAQEVTAGDAPGGAVDLANILTRIPFEEDGPYEFITDPLPGSGTWNFQIAGRDGTKPLGNRGTALAISAQIVARPPDVAIAYNGQRLTPSVAAGVLTVGFSYDW